MNLEREELVAAWQGVELSISSLRLTLSAVDLDQAKRISKRIKVLQNLSERFQSEIRSGDRYGWNTILSD